MTANFHSLKRYGYWSGIAVLVTWALFSRFGDLAADPAFHLSKSAGVLFDPFSHSGNARSYLLFGELSPDQWNTYLYSPIYVLLQIVWFSALGISVKTMHGFGALWSTLGVLLAFVSFRHSGRLAGLLALTFFSVHAIYSQLGRLALIENFAIFFIALTIWTLAQPLTRWRAGLCGLFAFIVFISKGTIFYVVPAAGAAVLVALVQQYLSGSKIRELLLIFGCYLLGTLTAFLPWLFLFRIPNKVELARVAAVWWKSVTPGSWSNSFQYLINDQLFQRIDRHDLLAVVALIMVGVTLYRLLTDWRRVQPIVVLCFFCLLFGALFVGLLRYKPTRFCQPILPALFGLAALGLAEFWQKGEISSSFKKCWAADLAALLSLTAIAQMVLYTRHLPRSILQIFEFKVLPGQWNTLLASFIAACLVWLIVRLVLRVVAPRPLALPLWLRSVAVAGFILHFLYGNLDAQYRWWNDRDHSIVEAGRRLRGRPHMVIGGLSVHALVMENTHRAVRVEQGGWHNSLGRKTFTHLGLTHFLLTDYNNLRQSYLHHYRRRMAKLTLTDRFKMCGQTYYLYQLPDEFVNKHSVKDKK